jgi:hypothetical protein
LHYLVRGNKHRVLGYGTNVEGYAASVAYLDPSFEGRTMMSVSGNWTLHYSWGCSNNYSQQPITFNSNGTFSAGGTGKWIQQDGTLLLSFDTGPAKYGGTVDGSVGSGAMSTFDGSTNGCWYLSKQGTSGIAAAAAAHGPAQSYDAAGNKTSP